MRPGYWKCATVGPLTSPGIASKLEADGDSCTKGSLTTRQRYLDVPLEEGTQPQQLMTEVAI